MIFQQILKIMFIELEEQEEQSKFNNNILFDYECIFYLLIDWWYLNSLYYLFFLYVYFRTTGTSYTYFTFENYKSSKALIKILEEANQEIPPKLLEFARALGNYY